MAIQIYAATADAVGTVAGTYNITGSNDQLSVSIDGGSNQVFTLTHGGTRTATQIVADLAALTGAVATVNGSGVRITTTSALAGSSSITFNTPSNNANSALGFASVTGSARQNSTFTGATIQNIADGVETVLLAAGWTTISGHGTTNLLMQSGLTPSPQNLNMRLRVKATTNCCTFSIENAAGSKVGSNDNTHGLPLLPAAAKTFRVIANKYQAFVFTAGSTGTAREFIAFGVPNLPSQLQGVVTEAFWGVCNSQSDSGASSYPANFRQGLTHRQSNGNAAANYQVCCNGNIWEADGNVGGGQGAPGLLVTDTAYMNSEISGFRWHDDSAFIIDAIIAWGLTAVTDEAKGRGYLWDAFLVTESFAADQTISVTINATAYNTWVITSSNTGQTGSTGGWWTARGTLFLITP